MMFLVMGYVGYTYSELMHNAMLRTAGRPESLSAISGAGIGLGRGGYLDRAHAVTIRHHAPIHLPAGIADNGFGVNHKRRFDGKKGLSGHNRSLLLIGSRK
jgi:hypothetical protein